MKNGNWNGQQLISKDWIQSVQQPSKPNPSYGYMWWINQQGKRYWEGVSEKVYYAAGFGGNFIVVDEEHDLVIVTRWLEPKRIGEMVKLVVDAFE